MQKFTCKRCGYDTTDVSNFKKHLKRKTICAAIYEDVHVDVLLSECSKQSVTKTVACDQCQKGFASKSGLVYHLKVTKCGQKTVNSKLADLQAKVEKLESKIDDRKSKNSNLVSPEILLELQYYKNRKNENFYQLLLEQYLGGTHKTLPCGITDISTDDCHAEIKEWKSWKEAIGQLTCYNSVDPRPFLAMYMFGKYSDSAKQRSINVAKNCGFAIYEFKESEDGAIYVEDCTTNERKYTYKPTVNLE